MAMEVERVEHSLVGHTGRTPTGWVRGGLRGSRETMSLHKWRPQCPAHVPCALAQPLQSPGDCSGPLSVGSRVPLR